MPNQLYPDNIYLQGNLRLAEKRTVRNDARISNRGNSKNPGPTQRPNNSIPLKEWIQEQIDNNTLTLPCSYDSSLFGTLPQACVKFKKSGGLYSAVSCSATSLPENCEKSYKIFNTLEQELFSGTLEEANDFILEDVSIETDTGYKIVEYITCGEDSSESIDACFEKYIFLSGPDSVLSRVKPSCRCCENVFEAYSSIINWICLEECIQINFATLFDSNINQPATVVIDSVINSEDIEYTMTQNIDLPLIYEFCPNTKTGIVTFEYHFEDGNENVLGNSATVQINLDCA